MTLSLNDIPEVLKKALGIPTGIPEDSAFDTRPNNPVLTAANSEPPVPQPIADAAGIERGVLPVKENLPSPTPSGLGTHFDNPIAPGTAQKAPEVAALDPNLVSPLGTPGKVNAPDFGPQAAALPKLEDQGPHNKVLGFLSHITGMSAPTPEPGKPYEGPTKPGEKTGNLLKFLTGIAGAVGNAGAAAAGTPEQQQMANQRVNADKSLQEKRYEAETRDAEMAPFRAAQTANTAGKNATAIEVAKTRSEPQMIRARAAAEMAGQDPDTGQPIPPDEIANHPLLAAKIQATKALDEYRSAQTAALSDPTNPKLQAYIAQTKANADLAAQRLDLAQANYGLAKERVGIERSRLGLQERRTDALYGGGDSGAETPDDAATQRLSLAAQKVLMEAEPTHDQIKQLKTIFEGMKDDNTPGKFLADRALYSLGIQSDIGNASDAIAQLELNKVAGAARVLKGSSRAIQALYLAMKHLPNVWLDSPKMIYGKLDNLDKALEQIKTDTIRYGQKSGMVPTGDFPPAPLPRSAAASVKSPKKSAQPTPTGVTEYVRGADGKLHPKTQAH